MKKIVLFELNEVPLRIFDQFCAWNPDSFLARFLRRTRQFETVTEDTNLSPWTTWPTLHRGVEDQRHTIHHFGQPLAEIDQAYPPLWELLQRRGVSTGVFGSLHSYPLPTDLNSYRFYIPDAFAAGSECFPQEVSVFQEFNLAMSRDSARVVSAGVHWGKALRFLLRAPELGLKVQTAAAVGGQLALERLQRWRKTRRRTYQAVLAFDVFMKQLERARPAFATFFTNHVASSMHRYWAAVFPQDYEKTEFDDGWVRTYRHEIDFTMSWAERFVRRLARFADHNPEYQLWIATSMGQAATLARQTESQLILSDLPLFMSRMGLAADEWEQRAAMIPQTNVCVTPSRAGAFRAALESLVIEGRPVTFQQREHGFFSISLGYRNIHERVAPIQFAGKAVPFEHLGLSVLRIDDLCGATAYHVPKGSLLVYDSQAVAVRHRRPSVRAQISTRDIAPAILRNFHVPIPDYMVRTPLAAERKAA